MEIVWDERKRVVNLDKHGMDFEVLSAEFFAQATIFPGKKGRSIAVGYIDGIIAVVFVLLGTEAVSVISMRPASKSERKRL
jgi:uncharacterized DUF497 family protein